VHFTTGEAFTNRYIASTTQGSNLGAFLDELCDVDVLIIDDLQFLVGKKRTQEALLEIASSLLANDRQLVVSCNCKPSDLEEFSVPLLSLLRGGLAAPIESPSFDTRVQVVKAKALGKGYELPDVTAEFLARHVTGSLRELEGALICLINVAQLHGPEGGESVAGPSTTDTTSAVSGSGATLTIGLARIALDDFLPSGGAAVPKAITAEAIIDAVADFYKIPLKDVLSPVKVRTVVRARQVGMFLTRELTPLSLAQIGARFGGRDHTTVLYALRCVERVHSRDPEFLADLDLLRSGLGIR
jgi:chromosomal replication initiator protein